MWGGGDSTSGRETCGNDKAPAEPHSVGAQRYHGDLSRPRGSSAPSARPQAATCSLERHRFNAGRSGAHLSTRTYQEVTRCLKLRNPMTRRVVVGVDGSREAGKALDWAIAEVIRFPAVLEIVTAWFFPMALGFALSTTVEQVRLEAGRILNDAVSHVTDVTPDIVVRSTLSEAEPGPALVDQSSGPDLLVVGSRGLGSVRELLPGSVGTFCARHSRCSLVIVR